MGPLVNILYHITLALRVPVIITLLTALIWMLFEAGGFGREWLDRKLVAKKWRGFLAQIVEESQIPGDLKKAFFELGAYPTLLTLFATQSRHLPENPTHLDKLISEIEIEANKRCYRMRVGTRVGPILGLMGTLIPMGPALLGITTGDLESMAGNLIVAFSTTVIGLLIGASCLMMLIARQYWYAKDMSDLEYLFETAFSTREKTS